MRYVRQTETDYGGTVALCFKLDHCDRIHNS